MRLGRHFGVLLCATLVVEASAGQQHTLSLPSRLALYGALHGMSVVAAVHDESARRGTFWTRSSHALAFITLAAALSMCAMLFVTLATWVQRAMAFALDGSAVIALVTGVSALQAALYASLIRGFWLQEISRGTVGWIATVCASSMLALMTLHTLNPFAGVANLAVAWWFSFSIALGFFSARRTFRLSP